jgi:hypothetical protein
MVVQRMLLIALQPQGHFIFLLAPFLRFIDLLSMTAKLFAHLGALTRKTKQKLRWARKGASSVQCYVSTQEGVRELVLASIDAHIVLFLASLPQAACHLR